MSLASIIIVDFEGSVERGHLRRLVGCLEQQTDQDFEILLYHDGPQEIPYTELLPERQLARITLQQATPTRYNDFGHSLRDLGIRQATGEYIMHINADNVLYAEAISEIRKVIDQTLPPMVRDGYDKYQPDMIIFPVLMRGMLYHHHQITRHRAIADHAGMIVTGIPPRRNNIDCMQVVMKRSLWLAEGGWTDRSADSDGILYERFARKYGIRTVPRVLGEHW